MDKQSKEMQELDADMAKIMKYEIGMREQCKGIWVRVNELNEISDWFDWHPTSNIAQAFEVVEKVQKEDFWFSCSYKSGIFLSDINKGGWQVRFRCVRGGTRGEHWAEHETLEIPVCFAAKKAWEAK